MAQQTSAFTFTGKFRDVIGFRRNGTYFFRSMPQEVRQTAASKRAAHNFGIASKNGRLIRSAFAAELDVHDGSVVNRLNGRLIKAGRNSHTGIAGFQFNQHTGIDRFFPVTPVFSKEGKLHIPAQQMMQFKGITALEVKLIAARIDFTTRRVTGTATDMLHINLSKPFEGADMQVEVPGNGTLVVTLQVIGQRDGYASCNRKHQAADVIAIVEPGKDEVIQKPVSPYRLALQERMKQTVLPAKHEVRTVSIQRE